jgi:hypothetical protein
MLGGGIADTVSMWGADWLLIGAIGHAIDIILDRGHDAEPSAAQAMADLGRMRTFVTSRPYVGARSS